MINPDTGENVKRFDVCQHAFSLWKRGVPVTRSWTRTWRCLAADGAEDCGVVVDEVDDDVVGNRGAAETVNRSICASRLE